MLKPRRGAKDSVVPLELKVLSNRPIKGLDDGIRIIVNGKLVKTLPTHEWEGERVIRSETDGRGPEGQGQLDRGARPTASGRRWP